MCDVLKTAKHDLTQYRVWKLEIDHIEQILTHQTPRGGCLSEIKSRKRELLAQCYEMERRINQLPPFERTILFEWYVCNTPWQEIADKLGCSLQQTDEIHRRALKLYHMNVPIAGE